MNSKKKNGQNDSGRKTCENGKDKLEFDEKSVKQGFVWSIILGDPVSRKRR